MQERVTSLSGGNRELVPPDPIPNSEVKRLIADDSVGLPHVKVGHCQTLILKIPQSLKRLGYFFVYRIGSDRRVRSEISKANSFAFDRSNASCVSHGAGCQTS